MKRLFLKCLTCLVLWTVVLYTGCEPRQDYFSYDELSSNVKRIELINYINENPTSIESKDDMDLEFKFENMQVLFILDEKYSEAFFKDLSGFKLFSDYKDSILQAPVGLCLRLVLENGNFIVFSYLKANDRKSSMIAEFDANCNFVRHIGYFSHTPSYDDIIKKYFDLNKWEQVPNM